jgi:hypothetical protein
LIARLLEGQQKSRHEAGFFALEKREIISSREQAQQEQLPERQEPGRHLPEQERQERQEQQLREPGPQEREQQEQRLQEREQQEQRLLLSCRKQTATQRGARRAGRNISLCFPLLASLRQTVNNRSLKFVRSPTDAQDYSNMQINY